MDRELALQLQAKGTKGTIADINAEGMEETALLAGPLN